MKATGSKLMLIESLVMGNKSGVVEYDTERAVYIVNVNFKVILETKSVPDLFAIMVDL